MTQEKSLSRGEGKNKQNNMNKRSARFLGRQTDRQTDKLKEKVSEAQHRNKCRLTWELQKF